MVAKEPNNYSTYTVTKDVFTTHFDFIKNRG